MRILLIASAYNGMTQRAHVELAERGHEVSVELAVADRCCAMGSAAMTRTGRGADADHGHSRGHLVGSPMFCHPSRARG